MSVADEQDFLKQRPDLGAEGADEGGEGGEVRGAVARECNEGDLFAAGALDVAAADDSATVGEQNDFQQHGRRVGAGAGEIILVAGVEAGQIQFVIDQVVQGVFEGVRMQLPFEIDGNEARAGVYLLVAGHGISSKRDALMTLDIPFGSQQNSVMKRLFPQPRWA
jgi:hypothetical protein